MVKPLSPKRQRTRAALVAATSALIAEKGLAGVTLDDVARRAGVTKGAIYSNYRSKGELLWAAVEPRRLHARPKLHAGDALGTARAMAGALMEELDKAEREQAFLSELQSYIRTDPELQAEQAAQQKAQFDWIAQELQATFGDGLGYPARVVGLAVQALALGFAAQRERTPDEVTPAVVTAAYEMLALGATRRG
jgi:AcrR family transcriptional regulator